MDIKHLPRLPGTYTVTCLSTEEKFVGYSKNLRIWGKVLRSSLNCGRACSRLLQDAWNEHGQDNFEINILCLNYDKTQEAIATGQYSLNIFQRPSVPRNRWRDPKCGANFRTHAESALINKDIIDGMSDIAVHTKWNVSIGSISVRKGRLRKKGLLK